VSGQSPDSFFWEGVGLGEGKPFDRKKGFPLPEKNYLKAFQFNKLNKIYKVRNKQ